MYGLIGATTINQELSIIVILLFGAVLLCYFLFRMGIQKKTMHRVARSDMMLYYKNKKKYHDDMMNVFSSTPQVVGEIAGLTIASAIIAVTLMMTMVVGSFEYNISMITTLLLSIAGISFLFSMEQMTTLISPSVPEKETFRLYDLALNMKLIGFVGLWSAVLTVLLLSNNIYVVLISCGVTGVVLIAHYEARWVRKGKGEEALMFME